jgi:hypothetical protein
LRRGRQRKAVRVQRFRTSRSSDRP